MSALTWLAEHLNPFAKVLAEGAVTGGAAGALTDPEHPEEGAATGALTGAIAAPGGYGLTKLTRLGLKEVPRFGFTDPHASSTIRTLANRELLERLHLDETPPALLEQRLRDLTAAGHTPTVTNLAGANTLNLTGEAFRTPTTARNAAEEALRAQKETMKPLLQTAVRNYITPTTDVLGEQRRLQQLKTTTANQQYGAARAAFPQLSSPKLDQDLYRRLKDVGADKLANDVAKASGEPLLPTADFMRQGSTPQLGLREWDLLKRGLDSKIERTTGRTEQGALKSLRGEVLDELDRLTTDPQTGTSAYGQARGSFHDFSTTQAAIDAGREFDKGNSDDVLDNFHQLSPADQAAFRVGVGRRINDIAKDKVEGVGLLNSIMKTRGDQLQNVMPSPQHWEDFQAAVDPLYKATSQSNKLLGGSPTHELQTAGETETGAGGPLEAIAETKKGGPSVALRLGLRMLGKDPRELRTLRMADLTNMLTSTDFHQNLATLQGLKTQAERDAFWKRVGKISDYGGAGLAGTAAGAGAGAVLSDSVEGEDTLPPDITELKNLLQQNQGQGMASGGRPRRSGYPDFPEDPAFRLNNPHMQRHGDPHRFVDVPEIYRRADEAYRVLDELGRQNAALQDTRALGWDPKNAEDVNSPFPVFGTDVYPAARRWAGEHLGEPGVAALIGGKDVLDNAGVTQALSWALSNPESLGEDLRGAGQTLLNFGPLGWGGKALRNPLVRRVGALGLAGLLLGDRPAPAQPTPGDRTPQLDAQLRGG